MPLFKSGQQVFEQGHDFVKRGDFDTAFDRFCEAAAKFSREGNSWSATLAGVYAGVADLGRRRAGDPMAYRQLAQSLRGLGGTTLKLGPREVAVEALAAEAELQAESLEVGGCVPTDASQHEGKAQRLRALAMRYQQAGDQTLVFQELFHKVVVQAASKAPLYAAMAEEAMGQAVIDTDPRKAAEHYQNARQWWMQIGYTDAAAQAASRVQAYGRTAKCWFCGREVSGEGVHFLAMPSDLTGFMRRTAAESALPTFDAAGNAVYACRGCRGAMHRLADELAQQRTRELEQRMMIEVEALRRELSSLGTRVATIRTTP